MAISIRSERRRVHFRPTSAVGWTALALLGVSLILWFARIAFAPTIPLNYLVVMIATGVAGLVALYAVTVAAERSIAVVATMVIGLIAATWLLAESMAGPTPVKLNASDNGRTVTLTAGTDIDITLSGNPTTGYTWEGTIGNAAVLKERSAVTYEASSNLIGAGGTYTFHYRAATAGTSDLTLIYHRTWETGVAPQQTYKLTIVVQ